LKHGDLERRINIKTKAITQEPQNPKPVNLGFFVRIYLLIILQTF